MQSGNTYYLTYDQVDSLRAVMDSTGTVVKQVDYDSFGSIINDSNSGIVVPFGFAGGLHDRDTGLVRFGYRDYDPVIGTFISKDPIGFKGGDTNLYRYVKNRPATLIDPFGLQVGGVIGGDDPSQYTYLQFNNGNGTLSYVTINGSPLESWPAVSGPWGKGPAPAGPYTVNGAPVTVPPSNPNYNSYCDPSGNCWWVPITPNFTPDPFRDGLGIHPDGGVPGTSGCIGAKGRNTQNLRNFLTNNPGLPLIVQ